MCKFGTSCKYHHPQQEMGSLSPVSLNFYGYPLRQVRALLPFVRFVCLYVIVRVRGHALIRLYMSRGKRSALII